MPQETKTLRATLDNGLTVLIKEVPRVPVASFWIWYRVGGRNEVPGITGISHWTEHMLFKGTPTYRAGEIFRTISKHGGTLNGFTWIDFTAYFETLPRDKILLAMDIEADRMRNAVFDPAEVQSERTVILSEREGNENQPTFYLREEVNATAFKAHPYGQGVIGFTSDLQQITRDDLYRHYQTYYVPNNAAVILSGAIDGAAMLDEITARFGHIERGPEPAEVRTVEPEQQGERRVVVRRPAPTPTLLVAYHAPRASDPDAPAVAVLDAILSGGKSVGFGGGGGMGRSSRLYRALVARGLASGAGSSFALTVDPYLLSISAALVPSADPVEVEGVVSQEIDKLRHEAVPEAELTRAIKQIRAQFAYAGESVTSQAYWLGSVETVAPGVDADELLERLVGVTSEDILRVANKYLTPERRTVGWLEPTAPAAAPVETAPPGPVAYRPHFFSDGTSPQPAAPRLGLRERRLDNEIHLLGHHDPTSDVAVVDVRLTAGATADGDTPGLARFTGQMLTRGTARRSFAALNEELDSLGASIDVGVAREYVDITGRCLKEDIGRLVELMAEVILQPTFPEEEIERVRGQSLTALRHALEDTRAQADYTLQTTLYPAGHPYHHRSIGTEETLETINQGQLRDFHQRAYRPDRTIMAVAGGAQLDDLWGLLAQAFGGWAAPAAEAPPVTIPDIDPPTQRIRREERIPGKSQSDVALGLPTLSRSDPDYDALRMANFILGRLGLMGRLGANVRDRQGMAYYASSALQARLGRGRWFAYAGVNPGNVDRAIDSIIEEIERLRSQPVEPEELADAKSYIIGSLPLGLESSGAIADTALDIAFYGLGLDYVERLPERMEALTAEMVRGAAERYLLPDRLAIAVARPDTSE